MNDIIYITIDSLRADYVSYFNPESSVETPTLDRLAAEGQAYHRCFANGPHTTLSVPSLLTGEYTPRVNSETPTLAELLRRGSYQTASFCTNVQLSGPSLKNMQLERGFDTFRLLTDMPVQVSMPLNRILLYGGRAVRKVTGVDSRPYHYTADLISAMPLPQANPAINAKDVNELTVEWLRSANSDPVFIWNFYLDPHEPWLPPTDYLPDVDGMRFKRYRMHRLNKKYRYFEPILDEKDIQYLQGMYAGSIRYLDDRLGELLASVRSVRGSEPTVIVTSDHGELFGEYGELGHSTVSYDELLRVPLIINGPDIKPVDNHTPVGNLDVVPTISELGGVDSPGAARGSSLLRSNIEQTHGEAVSIIDTDPFTFAYRTEEWKLLNRDGERYLYDLPDETKDISESRPELVEELSRAAMEHIGHLNQQSYDQASATVSGSVAEQLRALGYDE